MKNSTVKILSLLGMWSAVIGLILLFCVSARADIIDKVLPGDKDAVLEPIIGPKPEPNQIIPKTDPIIVAPYSDIEAQQIRKDWHDTLGVDIWQPYYLLQDFENMLRNHLRVKFGPFIGRPYFNYKIKAIEYRFVWRF
jgi:hypothetical protein